MHKSSPRAPSKNKSKTNPLHTSKRTKVWKKKQQKRADGEATGPTNTQPRHLQYEIQKRVAARHGLTLSDIKPKFDFKILPNKENSFFFERPFDLPQDLQHRVLSYMDQFDTPLRPKQIVHHFVAHPTNPVQKDFVYRCLKKLSGDHNVWRIKKIDEEGTDHWFLAASAQSRIRHNRSLSHLILHKRPLPLDEVVWESFENRADSWANFREMSAEQKASLELKGRSQV